MLQEGEEEKKDDEGGNEDGKKRKREKEGRTETRILGSGERGAKEGEGEERRRDG